MKSTRFSAYCSSALIAVGAFSPLYAEALQKKQPEPPPFDADLFRKDEQVVSASLEFLYWTVEEGALDYALQMTQTGWGPTACYAQGNYAVASYDWDPGFRVAFSFFRAPKFWEVKGQYTHIVQNGSDTVSKPSPQFQYLNGTWPQFTSAPLAYASSQIHLNYNVFDFLADRYFIPNPHLRLRLLGGALVAWMNQDWKVKYRDSSDNGTDIRNRWNYTGGGMKVGVMLDWFWTSDIYMTALGMTGIMLGSYHNKAEQTVNFQPAGNLNPSIACRNMKFSDVRPAATIQFFFGPSWQKNFTHNRVEVFAGYELNTWFNLQEIYRSTSGSQSDAKETWINQGMLALQGLTTRVTVDF